MCLEKIYKVVIFVKICNIQSNKCVLIFVCYRLLYWQQEGGVLSVRSNFFLHPFYSVKCNCRLHLEMAWRRGLNGNKPDGLVLPSKVKKQEPPQVAACGGSILCFEWNNFFLAYWHYSICKNRIQYSEKIFYVASGV